jgi:hypothetical protein
MIGTYVITHVDGSKTSLEVTEWTILHFDESITPAPTAIIEDGSRVIFDPRVVVENELGIVEYDGRGIVLKSGSPG